MRAIFSLLVFVLCGGPRMQAQDLHFSQFYHHSQQYNPALTGVFQGEWRAGGLHRSQWASVPVAYRTYAVCADWKAWRRRAAFVGLGAFLQTDRAGDAGLRWTQGGAQLGVSHALGRASALSVGAGLSVAQRAFDLSGLRFKNQWAGDVFDPDLPSKEPLERRGALVPLLATGLNYHYEPGDGTERRVLDAGLSLSHFNRPAIQFADDETPYRLPTRRAAYIQAVWQARTYWDLVVFGIYQHMGTSRNLLAGGGLRRWLRLDPGHKTALRFTLAVRSADAFIPALQVEYESCTLGMSYDINVSGFQTATSGRGGMEIALVYRPLPVPPPKPLKTCPVF